MPPTYRYVRQVLLDAGWTKLRQRGSHEVWTSPDVDGVCASADTREEAAALMREALPAHIDALREGGLTVPEPTHHAEFLTA